VIDFINKRGTVVETGLMTGNTGALLLFPLLAGIAVLFYVATMVAKKVYRRKREVY